MTEKKNLFGKLLEKEGFFKASTIVDDLAVKVPQREAFFSNSPCMSWMSAVGYYPGTMELLYGPKSSGKTMIMLDRIKNALKEDPESVAVVVDAEMSFEYETTLRWMRANGVDVDRVLVIREVCIKKIFEHHILKDLQLSIMNEGVKICYIAMDSIQAMSVLNIPDTEAAINKAAKDGALTKADYGKRANYLATIFPFFRKFCRDYRIFVTFIGQARSGGTDSYGNQIWATNGGEALYHEVQYRTLVTRAGDPIFDENQKDIAGKDVKIGHKIKLVQEKNKMGEGDSRIGYADIIYMKGFTNVEEELIMLCSKLGVIEQGGAWITYNDLKYNGTTKFAEYLKQNPVVYKELFSKMMMRATSEIKIEMPEFKEVIE
jgi:RecA/RadA recombinase